MIKNFLNFLSQNAIEYRVTNGYEDVFETSTNHSDYDILLKKADFNKIELTIKNFCNQFGYQIVQIYHQAVFAKNIFVYNERTNTLLNLDLYGELVRQNIKILDEEAAFSSSEMFKDVHILSPHHEFIQYLIKKIDKKNISPKVFKHLKTLYERNKRSCDLLIEDFFKQNQKELQGAFLEDDYTYIQDNIKTLKDDFKTGSKFISSFTIGNMVRVFCRIYRPTGLAIAFLGPDGSGKSTVITGLLKEELPFRRSDYFHLKPISKKESGSEMVTNPHGEKPYSIFVSFIKILLFFVQYNFGWFKNIIKLKTRSSLIIFDRYYDDLLIDPKRYRLGFTSWFAHVVRFFIPKPDIFFILTANAEVIHQRKQEVPLSELQRQILGYRLLSDNKRYMHIDVARDPEVIIVEIKQILMKKMHERY